jgi:hypothetical protein
VPVDWEVLANGIFQIGLFPGMTAGGSGLFEKTDAGPDSRSEHPVRMHFQ